MTRKPYDLTVTEAVSAIAAGELTILQLVESCLERIDVLEDRIQAWATVDREGAMEAAHQLDHELHQGDQLIHGLECPDVFDVLYTENREQRLLQEILIAKAEPHHQTAPHVD